MNRNRQIILASIIFIAIYSCVVFLSIKTNECGRLIWLEVAKNLIFSEVFGILFYILIYIIVTCVIIVPISIDITVILSRLFFGKIENGLKETVHEADETGLIRLRPGEKNNPYVKYLLFYPFILMIYFLALRGIARIVCL